MPTDPRTTTAYRQQAKQYKAQCRQRLSPCIHCTQPIDYTIEDTNDPNAFTIEHLHPVSTHPHLVLDLSNWAPAHRHCNSSRGTNPIQPGLGTTSENW
jgi:5-methylcytosine-specific restriction endonuclease McrA